MESVLTSEDAIKSLVRFKQVYSDKATVANPLADGLTLMKVSLLWYSQGFISGFLDRLKTGCSMLPMSAFGEASTILHTNISC